MDRDARRAARVRLVEAMRQGKPWHEAAAAAGLAVGRSTAYRLRRRAQAEGLGALEDRRHGHPSKLRAPVRAWLEGYCRGRPGRPAPPSHAVQAALRERFGLRVSVGHLNAVRAALGLGRPRGAGGNGPAAAARPPAR
jgi:transposase